MRDLLAQVNQQCLSECVKTGSPDVCIRKCGGEFGGSVPPSPGGITNPALGEGIRGQTGIGFFQQFLPNLVGLSFVIGVIIFFFVFIIGAIQWMLSGGDKGAVEQARSKITNAFIGLVILFAAFAVIKVVENFFGTNILTLDIGAFKIE